MLEKCSEPSPPEDPIQKETAPPPKKKKKYQDKPKLGQFLWDCIQVTSLSAYHV